MVNGQGGIYLKDKPDLEALLTNSYKYFKQGIAKYKNGDKIGAMTDVAYGLVQFHLAASCVVITLEEDMGLK